MRTCAALALPLLLVAAASAAEIESGVPVGGSITTYSCTKLGGIEDGVKVNQSLCYT